MALNSVIYRRHQNYEFSEIFVAVPEHTSTSNKVLCGQIPDYYLLATYRTYTHDVSRCIISWEIVLLLCREKMSKTMKNCWKILRICVINIKGVFENVGTEFEQSYTKWYAIVQS